MTRARQPEPELFRPRALTIDCPTCGMPAGRYCYGVRLPGDERLRLCCHMARSVAAPR